MHKSTKFLVKRFGCRPAILHICSTSFLFALALIQFSFTGCYNETSDELVGPERFTVTDGKFVGRNNEEAIMVVIVEKQRITTFTYQFMNASGYQCAGGASFGSAQEPIATISNNTFSIFRGDNLEFSGKFVSNDSCTGTWNNKSSNSLCFANRMSGNWVATRN